MAASVQPPKLAPPVNAAAGDDEALLQVVDCYHETLKASPEALKYLESRGLTDPELLTRFRLGFANRTLGYRLPEKNRKAGAEMRGRLQTLGVLRGMYGRKITANLRDGHAAASVSAGSASRGVE